MNEPQDEAAVETPRERESRQRAEARRRETEAGGFVPRPALDDYARKYGEHWDIRRQDGVIELRMHTEGGPARFNYGLRDTWWQLFRDVDSDPENEVMILTGTGPTWIGSFDERSYTGPHWEDPPAFNYDLLYYGTVKQIEHLVAMSFPTIGCVNGPGEIHLDLALLCDMTLCAEDAVFQDLHFFRSGGVPAGDGLGLALIHLLGWKRAAYHLYTGAPIDAQQARELGLVNEVLPRDQLVPRAREIAQSIMTKSRTSRRLHAEIVRRPWRRAVMEDLTHGLAHELYAMWSERQQPSGAHVRVGPPTDRSGEQA